MEESGILSLLIVMATAAVIIGITVGIAAVTWAFMFSQDRVSGSKRVLYLLAKL